MVERLGIQHAVGIVAYLTHTPGTARTPSPLHLPFETLRGGLTRDMGKPHTASREKEEMGLELNSACGLDVVSVGGRHSIASSSFRSRGNARQTIPSAVCFDVLIVAGR